MLRKPGYLDIPELDVYYKDCVIGGQGAFTVPVRERDQFIEAIKTKILLEVAGLTPAAPSSRAFRTSRAATACPAKCSGGIAGTTDKTDHDPADIGARRARRQERRHGPFRGHA